AELRRCTRTLPLMVDIGRLSVYAGAGRYTLLNLPAGTYEIEASKPGFASQVRKDQVFFVGTTITLDFTFQLAPAAQSVTVTGYSPVIPCVDCYFHPGRHRRGADAAVLTNKIHDAPAAVALLQVRERKRR